MKSKSRMARSIFSLFLVFSMILISFPTNAVVTDPLIPGGVGSLDNPGDVKIEKFAETTSTENEFKVTVTVEGKEKTDAAETDIVLVLDKSGSMAGSKMTAAKNTAKDFVNTLLPSGNTANRIGLVTFSDNASMVQALTNSAGSNSTGLIKAINDINTGGGTYIQKALVIAQDMLSSSTADHQYIVLLSDGAPTLSTQALTAVASSEIPGLSFKLTSFNSTKLGGSGTSYIINPPYNVSSYSVGNHGIPTLSQALIVKDADIEIFSIGFGLSGITNNATVADATWVLQNIANNGNYYPAADAEDLIDAFNSIAGDIIAPVKNGIVTDPIGQMYTYVSGSATVSQGSAAYDNSTKTLTWTIGTVPEGVQATMTYYLQMNVADPLFESDVFYPLNGTTTLTFTNVDGQSDSMDFLLPQASGKAAPIPVTLTTSVVGSGTIDPVAGDHDYALGTTVTVTATPASGWEFDRWNDAEGYTVPNASGEVQMDMDRKVEAIFKEIVIPPEDVTLTTSVVGSGTIDPSAGDHDYTSGAIATVTATPASGWEFDRWNDAEGFTVPDGSGKVLMDADKKVEAIFKEVKIQPGYGALHICKWVIHDEGVKLPDELPDFVVLVTGPNDFSQTVKLTHNESVTLENLEPGKYYVSETQPTGEYSFETINLTATMTDYEVVVVENKTVEAAIVNKYTPTDDPEDPTGAIEIKKFRDYNSDGIKNGSDYWLNNIQFRLEEAPEVDTNMSVMVAPQSWTMTTGSGDFEDGQIIFSGLPYGRYKLVELSPRTITAPEDLKDGEMYVWVPKWDQSEMPQTVYIEVGNFWSTSTRSDRDPDPDPDPDPGKISIFKFLDSNESGSYDSNEFPMENIVFQLFDSNKDMMESASTDTDGMMEFNNLEPGTYFIKEVRQNYTITTPGFDDDGYYEVDVDEDETVLIEVGNYRETVPGDPVPLGPPVVEDVVLIEEEDVPLALPQTGELPPYSAYAIGSLMILAGIFMKRKYN